MIKISFRNIISFDKNPGKKGVVRHRSVFADKERARNNQLVLTEDGLGTIKDQFTKHDENGRLLVTHGLTVAVRNLKYKTRVYNPKDITVIDIIDEQTGKKYPAVESDYNLLLLDDAPVEFIVTRKGKAILTNKSREKMQICKIFARKQNGIKLFNELTTKHSWNPIKR